MWSQMHCIGAAYVALFLLFKPTIRKIMKLNTTVLEETITKLKEALPGDLSEIKRINEEKLRMILESMLQKMDLVSRNEYDIQTEVLKRTRERLEQLEQRISDLEQK